MSSSSFYVGSEIETASGNKIGHPFLPVMSYGNIILTLTPIIPYLKKTCLTATST
jgi:hypothetical protein